MNHCWGVKSHIQTHSLPQIARLNDLPERTGLVHVMNEIVPSVGGEQATVINSWLQKVTSLIDIGLIDVESAK